MPNQSGKVVLVLALLLLLLGAAFYFFSPSLKKQEGLELMPTYPPQVETAQQTQNKSYKSKDLNISFSYPQDWFVNEKDFDLMITSFPTKFGENAQPERNQIKFFINEYHGCHETIDENLEDPACGEGGPKVKPNEILSKETEDINGMKFYKYLVKYPDGKQQRFYFLEKGDRVLQIDKDPDPSMLEKEFEEIVKSIKFDS